MSDFSGELTRRMQAAGVGVRELSRRSGYSTGFISQLRSGLRAPSPVTARDLDDALGAGGVLAAAARVGNGGQRVRRREFIALTSASVAGTVVAREHGSGIEKLALALTGLGTASRDEPPSDIAALAAAADVARRDYQACRYARLAATLPGLLGRLNTACGNMTGDARDHAHVLSADVHHVAASLMLKLGDQGLASLAADQSMRAAVASGDPVAVGGSARIVTHALMSGGHLPAAVTTATSHATRLDRDLPGKTPDTLSVYGSLLLRGAVAAAERDDRTTAHELLDEAEDAARQLGIDGNLRWTAFGPVNVTLHRVNIAVTLGDAGTAIDLARRVDPGAIAVTERKAALLIDTARAFRQRGRYESAYLALRTAYEAAPEEVTGRASVRNLAGDIAATAPPTLKRDAAAFAASIGAAP